MLSCVVVVVAVVCKTLLETEMSLSPPSVRASRVPGFGRARAWPGPPSKKNSSRRSKLAPPSVKFGKCRVLRQIAGVWRLRGGYCGAR